MDLTAIHIQGNIISSEVLERIGSDEVKFQAPADFRLPGKTSVRDAIGSAWASARAYWSIFSARRQNLRSESGASETRQAWMIPLLNTLGYEIEKTSAFIHPDTQKSYAISHAATNLGNFPIHIMGIEDKLDERREGNGTRLSPHSLAQEYLNHAQHTYALVSNGASLRLLRDSTRLVRLSYLEFDLEKIMAEERYSDFAILFRLLHASRIPGCPDQVEDSCIEYYHQESLASGSRIREKLSKAVENSIKELANGILRNPANTDLRQAAQTGTLPASDYYLRLLRLIYRLLFLIVIEERQLVYPDTKETRIQRLRKIYYDYYSIERLRKLATTLRFVDGRKWDLWEGLMETFQLFEKESHGHELDIKPLGSGLFSEDALGVLPLQRLDNDILLKVIRNLTFFENDQHQWVRVNYSDLDVEEFGSVYEGLLEYDPVFAGVNGAMRFDFVKGTNRSSSGSHYTPEELVKPLITHSLDYLIADRLKAENPEAALLDLKVADIACGSGHILLSAARRIGEALACVRQTHASGSKVRVEQASPNYIRAAIRDVIQHCIYGVDKNPLAVELCKVALWLEAHNPGQPLNFLDHHIKCGDAILGLAHRNELQQGIPNEAFKVMEGDDKEVHKSLSKRNQRERATRGQQELNLDGKFKELDTYGTEYSKIEDMPQTDSKDIASITTAYQEFRQNKEWKHEKTMADLQLMQFFMPKDAHHLAITDAAYFRMLQGVEDITPEMATQIQTYHTQWKFFHWFLEFPKVFEQGGFDCILGNPPFLGGSKIVSHLGDQYVNEIKSYFYPAFGRVDLVAYFLKRISCVTKIGGFFSIISTNTISQGDTRINGLGSIVNEKITLHFACKSIRWPGAAAVSVSIVSLNKGFPALRKILNNKEVGNINSYLESDTSSEIPFPLSTSQNLGFSGSKISGAGFLLLPNEKQEILDQDRKNQDIVFPLLSADDVTHHPESAPSRFVINFSNFSEQKCQSEFPACYQRVKEKVYPVRLKSASKSEREKWWQYGGRAVELYNTISKLNRYLCAPRTTKYITFVFRNDRIVISDAVVVIPLESNAGFSIVSSSIHDQWMWYYCSKMGESLRYTPTIFATFPFPRNIPSHLASQLDYIGETYYETRRQWMLNTQLGLTKTYNLYHHKLVQTASSAEKALVDKTFDKLLGKDALLLRQHLAKQPSAPAWDEAVAGILELRRLHVEMDHAVAAAYGWEDIPLRHDFYEVDYLPEHDRIRYTIHPDARREILDRLLKLNHEIHAAESNGKA